MANPIFFTEARNDRESTLLAKLSAAKNAIDEARRAETAAEAALAQAAEKVRRGTAELADVRGELAEFYSEAR